MPYIKADDRPLAKLSPDTPGELNFALTTLVLEYIQRHKLSYTVLNECLGALEAAKLEFYRRMIVPYEYRKRAENGDVYPFTG